MWFEYSWIISELQDQITLSTSSSPEHFQHLSSASLGFLTLEREGIAFNDSMNSFVTGLLYREVGLTPIPGFLENCIINLLDAKN